SILLSLPALEHRAPTLFENEHRIGCFAFAKEERAFADFYAGCFAQQPGQGRGLQPTEDRRVFQHATYVMLLLVHGILPPANGYRIDATASPGKLSSAKTLVVRRLIPGYWIDLPNRPPSDAPSHRAWALQTPGDRSRRAARRPREWSADRDARSRCEHAGCRRRRRSSTPPQG